MIWGRSVLEDGEHNINTAIQMSEVNLSHFIHFLLGWKSNDNETAEIWVP